MLAVALAEARQGLAEGGIPIGAAIFDAAGNLMGAGHNRRVQQGDPSLHGETDAFRNAGRQRSYRQLTMVTTLAPCWYCSGLVRQFGFGTVVVGESRNFQGGLERVCAQIEPGNWGVEQSSALTSALSGLAPERYLVGIRFPRSSVMDAAI